MIYNGIEFKDESVYLSDETGDYVEWKWHKPNRVPKPGQWLISEDKVKYDIKDVVIYTNEFTMINDYGKSYGHKSSINENNYDNCFWNRLNDNKDCHIVFLVCCNKSE